MVGGLVASPSVGLGASGLMGYQALGGKLSSGKTSSRGGGALDEKDKTGRGRGRGTLPPVFPSRLTKETLNSIFFTHVELFVPVLLIVGGLHTQAVVAWSLLIWWNRQTLVALAAGAVVAVRSIRE